MTRSFALSVLVPGPLWLCQVVQLQLAGGHCEMALNEIWNCEVDEGQVVVNSKAAFLQCSVNVML